LSYVGEWTGQSVRTNFWDDFGSTSNWERPMVTPTCQELQTGPGLPADLNVDCRVNLGDLPTLNQSWGTCNDPCDPVCQ
jgi:hypothetical protein